MHLAALLVYPIKGCRGYREEAVELDAYGISHDRRFLLVEGDGRFLTQRTEPRLALLEPRWEAEGLTVRFPERAPLVLPAAELAGRKALREAVVWRDTVQADDVGEAAAVWFSEALGRPCRLVRQGPAYRRPLTENKRRRLYGAAAVESGAAPRPEVSFADGWPLLGISQASLEDLNARMAQPLPMERFRPNLVFAGTEPYFEDRVRELRVGAVVLRAGGPCGRCIVTTTDQTSGERRGPEPLRTLATYRRDDDGEVNFGQNFLHLSPGRLRVGDRLEVVA